MALIKSPLPGKVIDYRVKEGDTVSRGDVLVILESMKMHNEICSDTDGMVERIIAPENEYIAVQGDLLEII